MLKVLIADDEPYVREEIKNIIPWQECGFKICGEGIDGDDTYEKICALEPDLVLIDIKMAGRSGLDVIRESMSNGFKGKFIIVSGYSDFNYAKEAIEYGVKSYILKPIDEDELMDKVNKIKDVIYQKINESTNNKIKMELIKEHVLSQFCLNNRIKESNDVIKSIIGNKFVVSLICNNKSELDNDNIIELEKYIKEKLAIRNINIFRVKDNLAILLHDKNIERIYSILEKLKKEILREKNRNLFITIGQEVNEIDQIYLSYNNAESLMKKRYLYLKEGIISNNKLQKKTNSNVNEEKIIDKLYTYIELGELDNIKKALLLLEKVIIEKNLDEEQIKANLTTYYVKIKDRVISTYKLKESLDHENKIIIGEIHNKGSLHEVIDVLTQKLSYISKEIAMNSNDKSINRIIKYVDNKYFSDLKLEGLAEIFNYNSSYLGKLFKDTTGKSFNTYLDIIRINQAKKLLKDDKLKVYEICEKVGYKNVDYFHTKFKKHVGTSPLNYRKDLVL